jgi:hypothetical protein
MSRRCLECGGGRRLHLHTYYGFHFPENIAVFVISKNTYRFEIMADN